ncbi:hypothetical protein ACODT3_08140 [Streptomyces sp. 4.24]|uniref:hypothetical protein n=1 Tax=Streptomyces tritrimontium TaxID=3406573 RepID=UPI003BB51220
MDENSYAERQDVVRRQPPDWTPVDDHLLYTCAVVHDLVHGRLSARPPVPSRVRLAPGELPLASGPATRYTWRALGNGSYQQSSVVAFGGTGFVLGSMAASALGNAARRNRAAADAQPRWAIDGPGELTVTDRRAYFGHPQSYLDLNWSGLATMDLVGADVFECGFQNVDGGGFLSVRVQSLWASLMFALAAHSAFPAHPRLLNGGWLPPDFEARCAAAGRVCPQVR